VVKNSRATVHGILTNAAAGCSAAEIADMFEVPSDTVRRIVAFAEAQEPTAEQELYDIILDLVSQNCTYGEDDDAFDSWAISAYERAIIALEQAGYVEIDDGPGRIAGKLTEQGRMFDAWMALHDQRRRIADARRHLATVPGATERRESVARLYDISVAEPDEPPMQKTLRRMYKCTSNGCPAITERPALDGWTPSGRLGTRRRGRFLLPAHTAAIIDDTDNDAPP
jgi:hypothetical protein